MTQFNLPKQVKIVEVGPRDGLQNESTRLTTLQKIELIHRLSDTGLTVIESTSFVRPDKIPQLADSDQLLSQIQQKPEISYPVLTPNLNGLERAINAGAKAICVFTTVSETFCQKNTNCTIEESLERIAAVSQHAQKMNLTLRGYISCVFGCPYEGRIDYSETTKLCQQLLKFGCYEVALGDTIGVATPGDVLKCYDQLKHHLPLSKVAMHFHNTYGQALANVLMAMEIGVTTFDASIAGLGGCPYARGATGNLATEDLVYMLNGLGIQTGVDIDKLLSVSAFVKQLLPKSLTSKVATAILPN